MVAADIVFSCPLLKLYLGSALPSSSTGASGKCCAPHLWKKIQFKSLFALMVYELRLSEGCEGAVEEMASERDSMMFS